jgi:hypothetical protein
MSPNVSPTFKPTGSVAISGAQNVNIINKSVTASIEASQALTANLKSIIIRARGVAKLQVAFVSTESQTKYLTIPKKASLELNLIDFSAKTLYVTSDLTTIVEIMELY